MVRDLFQVQMYPRYRQFRPILRQLGRNFEAIVGGMKSQESVQHHLRREDAFDELFIESQAARRVAALH